MKKRKKINIFSLFDFSIKLVEPAATRPEFVFLLVMMWEKVHAMNNHVQSHIVLCYVCLNTTLAHRGGMFLTHTLRLKPSGCSGCEHVARLHSAGRFLLYHAFPKTDSSRQALKLCVGYLQRGTSHCVLVGWGHSPSAPAGTLIGCCRPGRLRPQRWWKGCTHLSPPRSALLNITIFWS